MISVIIPAYNAEKTIRRCLDSVVSQSVAAEIILADDGSEDATASAAGEYGDRVRLLALPHGGVSAARNAGLAAAKGDWVLFLDADDVLQPDALEKLSQGMFRDVDAVCGAVSRGNEKYRSRGKARSFPAGHALMDHVLADPTDLLTIHAWAFRRREDMPVFDPALRIGEDSDWVLRYLGAARKAVFVPENVYRYTVSDDSTVHKWREGQTGDYLKMLTKLSLGPAGAEKGWSAFVLTNYLLILTHVIFHPHNPGSRREQLKDARSLRDEPLIRAAFDSADPGAVSMAKRIVLGCVKRDLMTPAYIAVKLRQKQNEKRAGER